MLRCSASFSVPLRARTQQDGAKRRRLGGLEMLYASHDNWQKSAARRGKAKPPEEAVRVRHFTCGQRGDVAVRPQGPFSFPRIAHVLFSLLTQHLQAPEHFRGLVARPEKAGLSVSAIPLARTELAKRQAAAFGEMGAAREWEGGEPSQAFREGGEWRDQGVGPHSKAGLSLLCFLFITHKSFAFY